MVTIRAWQSADLPQLHAIETRAQLTPWTFAVFKDCWQAGYAGWVAVDAEQTLQGFCITSMQTMEAEILNLCVDPECQRQGIGRKLLSTVIQQAHTHAIDNLFLEVRASNTAAQGLYQQQHFLAVGRRKNYYRQENALGAEDALILTLNLR